jgi:flavorubredoxin
MRALVLYRTWYGNTKQVAEALARGLQSRGVETVVQDVRQALPDVQSIDMVLDGAPTRIARVNRHSRAVLRKLRARGFGSKPVAVFDTCAVIPTDPAKLKESERWLFPGAVGKLHAAAKDLGLNVYEKTLRCEVNGMEGPLVDGALEKAEAFARDFADASRR